MGPEGMSFCTPLPIADIYCSFADVSATVRRSMVSCPICEEIVDAEYINMHLDQNCSLSTREIEGFITKQQKQDGFSLDGVRTNGSAQAKAWASVLGPRAVGVGRIK